MTAEVVLQPIVDLHVGCVLLALLVYEISLSRDKQCRIFLDQPDELDDLLAEVTKRDL